MSKWDVKEIAEKKEFLWKGGCNRTFLKMNGSNLDRSTVASKTGGYCLG